MTFEKRSFIESRSSTLTIHLSVLRYSMQKRSLFSFVLTKNVHIRGQHNEESTFCNDYFVSLKFHFLKSHVGVNYSIYAEKEQS